MHGAAVNPQLTIMALATRLAFSLLGREIGTAAAEPTTVGETWSA